MTGLFFSYKKEKALSYVALYRKFRPQTFEEVKGQDAIVTTLRNQVLTDRVGHAYIFAGTRGTGKTSVAKILARAVNCEHPVNGSPCNTCDSCRAILRGTSTNVVEIDAASNNGVDNIRQIREEVSYRPATGRYKVYIIDEAHMLSGGAFNALLKTLEEPPEYVIFILATTEIHKVPVTILSRCQRYNFHRISQETISLRIHELLEKEKVKADDKAIRYLAKVADGSMRDALSLLDQCISFYPGEELTYDKVLAVLGSVDTEIFSALIRSIVISDAATALEILDKLVQQGKEMTQFASDFTWYLRNLMLVQSSKDMEDALDVSSENLKKLQEEAEMVPPSILMRYIRICSELSDEMRRSTQKRVLAEMALIRMCRPQMETDIASLLDRIRVLETAIENLKEEMVQGLPASGRPSRDPENETEQIEETSKASGKRIRDKNLKKELPLEDQSVKEAPADLKMIRSKWKLITGRIKDEPLHTFLSGMKPGYDAASSGNVLYLVAPNQITYNWMQKETNLSRAAQVISETVGGDVRLELWRDKEAGKDIRPIPLEEVLEASFGMPVEMYPDDEAVERMAKQRDDPQDE